MPRNRRGLSVAIGITKLGEDPFGGENVELRVAGKLDGLRVTFFPGIKQRKKIKRVGKDRSHFFGSPRR